MATKTKLNKTQKGDGVSKAEHVYKAKLKYSRISPFKVRRVADQVRSTSTDLALPLLKRLPHHGAEILYKVIFSALSNAKNNHKSSSDVFLIDKLTINEGPTLKRFQPKGRGRIYQILKRTCHIYVELKEIEGGQHGSKN